MATDKKVKKVDVETNIEQNIITPAALVQPKQESSIVITKSESSVQIEIDSKGSKKYTVKVYDEDPDVAKEKAIKISQELDKEIGR